VYIVTVLLKLLPVLGQFVYEIKMKPWFPETKYINV